MKRFLICCLLTLPLAVNAASYGIHEPEWEDFVPPTFVDIKEPKGILGKMNVIGTYWYNRRVKFEEGLEACRALDDVDAKYNCFEDLKSKQYRENSEYNAKIEAEQMRNSNPGMTTDTMIPLNNYINTFTKFQQNEFR